MATAEVDDQYFTYEGRLASFKASTKKRGSTTGGRGAKPQTWPHKQIAPASLANAGFFFCPFPDNPDNVMCFLCHKGLDGWESGDDPLLEHMTHSKNCGWAIVASIEAEMADYAKEDPSQPAMIEARKATFAGRWPHEGKRGWKCKTKQLVDAGWKYTPSAESDDMATCVYCQLALDGWEQNDKPLDEHYSRAPECRFFTLVNQSQGTKKKPARGKAARGSKASRLSGQSVATLASETTSIADLTAGPEDSVLTTASTMGKKGRAKKGTGKGRKTKAKTEEPVETEQPALLEEEVVAPPPPSPPKATRGKKRGSDAVDESTLTMSEAPAAKKRATKARGSNAVDSSVMTMDDTEMTDAPAPKKPAGRKGRPSKAQSTRKVSAKSNASNTSIMSLISQSEDFPDDDEIERQLQADLERQFSEDEIAADTDSERIKAETKKAPAAKPVKARLKMSADDSFEFAMFDPSPAEPDEAAVEDELKALEAEMEIDEPEQLQVAKKGRKPGVRKASKQTKAAKTKAPPVAEEEEPVEPVAPEPQPIDLPQDDEDASIGSTDTVVKTEPVRASTAKRGRGRPSKASLASQDSVEVVEFVEPAQPPVKRGRGRPSKVSLASQESSHVEETKPADAPVKRGRGRPSKASLASLASQDSDRVEVANAADPPVKRGRGRPPKNSVDRVSTERVVSKAVAPPKVEVQAEAAGDVKSEHAASPTPVESPTREQADSSPLPAAQLLEQPPFTPGKVSSPVASARQAALSPSQSPQSSDAENQPPSSKPATSATKRIILAPLTATPMRGSPSKRNVLAGLQSTTPWAPVDLDAVFSTPRDAANKENGVERLLKQGKDLTSPEKRMTVEEWVYFNASEAEKKLKHECETMVSRFESEGSKAMNVLEGVALE